MYKMALKLKNNMYSLQNNMSEGERQKLYNVYLALIRKSAYKGNSEAQLILACKL